MIDNSNSDDHPISRAIKPVIIASLLTWLAAVLICTIFFACRHAAPGLRAGLFGGLKVLLFSESTPLSMILLDQMGLTGAPFISGFFMIWVFKFIAVVIAGFLIANFGSVIIRDFAITIVVLVALVTPINVFGMFHARIPLVDPAARKNK